MAFTASCTAACTMASVRVATTLFWPLASMAFIVTSFHCRTAFPWGWAMASPIRHATMPAVATMRPRTRAPCFMGIPPCVTGRARQSRDRGLPVARGVEHRLEGRPVLEQGRLDGGIQLLVETRIVERHLLLAHRAHDAVDLARGDRKS